MIQGIYDNNLIKFITRPNHRSRYDRVVSFLHGLDLIDYERSQIVITPGGALEFLGERAPDFKLEETEASNLFAAIKTARTDFDSINVHRARALASLQRKVRQSGRFSKRTLAEKIVRELGYVDDSLKDLVGGLLKGNLHTSEGRAFLVSRIAIDCLQRIEWPADLRRTIYTAYIVDVHQAVEQGLGYNSPRSLDFVWNDFARSIEFQNIQGAISTTDMAADVLTLQQRFSFGTTGDFLDTEGIHYAVVGKFIDDGLHPILFCTQDPFEAVLSRLLLYRWLYHAGFQMVKKDDAAVPPQAPGVVVVFSTDLSTAYRIEVNQLPITIDFLKDRRLDAWIEEIKRKSQVEVPVLPSPEGA